VKLRRAIASFLQGRIAGLNALADRSDGKNVRYPLATFTALDRNSQVLGCGATDYRRRDEDGMVVKKGRVLPQETSLRIDLWVPGTPDKNAEERVEELAASVEATFEAWRFDPNPPRIVDPVSGDDLRVTAIRHIATVDLPMDKTGEPFLARKSLTYAVTHRRTRERDVTQRIERVHLAYGE